MTDLTTYREGRARPCQDERWTATGTERPVFLDERGRRRRLVQAAGALAGAASALWLGGLVAGAIGFGALPAAPAPKPVRRAAMNAPSSERPLALRGRAGDRPVAVSGRAGDRPLGLAGTAGHRFGHRGFAVAGGRAPHQPAHARVVASTVGRPTLEPPS
jgi:hypothetical protein